MKIGIKVWCEKNWFGQQCTTFCSTPPASSLNYRCDPRTGKKICTNGQSCTGFICNYYVTNAGTH